MPNYFTISPDKQKLAMILAGIPALWGAYQAVLHHYPLAVMGLAAACLVFFWISFQAEIKFSQKILAGIAVAVYLFGLSQIANQPQQPFASIPIDLIIVWIALATLPWLFSKHDLPIHVSVISLGVIGLLLLLKITSLPSQALWLFVAFAGLMVIGFWLLTRKSLNNLGQAKNSKDILLLQPGLLLLSAGLVLLLVMIKNAWVCDDAYITFRTIDNFIHGYGLTWNAGERVQVYTHPLWMFALSFARLVSGKMYFSSIYVSLLFALLAVLLAAAKVGRNLFSAAFVVLALGFSKAFVDYSASGLENPLIYLLLAIFFAVFWLRPWDRNGFFWLCFLASLVALTRMDAILILIPSLGLVAWHLRKEVGWRLAGIAVVAFSPFIAWELFSIWYYGFPFPNTAYAKLNTGFTNAQRLYSGLNYFLNSLRFDPVTMPLILLGLVSPFFTKDKTNWPVSLGIILYLVYILRIGGDFMSGRYFAVPVLCAVMILARSIPFSPVTSLISSGLILLLGLAAPFNPWASDENYRKKESLDPAHMAFCLDQNGIADERAFYYQVSGFLKVPKEDGFQYPPDYPLGKMIEMGKSLAKENEPMVMVANAIGFIGYYAGPKIHIVDIFALSNPLLARMPAKPNSRIGHFERELPAGYIDSLNSKKNRFTDPKIAGLYYKLANITQGPLNRWERFKDIFQLNLGSIDKMEAASGENSDERILAASYEKTPYGELINRGFEAARNNNWEQAARDWMAARKLEPGKPEANGNLGIYYEKQGVLKTALEYYLLAAEGAVSPWRRYADLVTAAYSHARVIGFGNSNSESTPGKDTTPAVTPTDKEPFNTQNVIRSLMPAQGTDEYAQLVNQGVYAASQNDWEKATQFWNSALKIDQSRHEANGNLGVVYEKIGNLSVAAEFYRRATEQKTEPWGEYLKFVERILARKNTNK